MTDFMQWFYLHYITPHLSDTIPDEYEKRLSKLRGALELKQAGDLEAAMEVYASESFLLGLRTGIGLLHSLKK